MKALAQHRYLFLAVLAPLSVILGCQTNELNAYKKLKPGMDKGDVLAIMGSPRRSERFHGEDKWTYQFYSDEIKLEKEVRFSDGTATYIGDPPIPAVSAAEQDRLNELENQKIEETYAKNRADAREKSSEYFDDNSPKKQIQYVPQFVPLR
jgi:outer membrane protein assembly factor BamE